MGWGRKLKKLTRKISKLGRIAAAAATLGATEIGGKNSIGAKYQREASRIGAQVGGLDPSVRKKEERMAAMAQAQMENEARQKAADEENRSFIAQVNQQRQSLLDRTKTDYTGDLTSEYEDGAFTSTKLLDRPLLTKRRKLLGM